MVPDFERMQEVFLCEFFLSRETSPINVNIEEPSLKKELTDSFKTGNLVSYLIQRMDHERNAERTGKW